MSMHRCKNRGFTLIELLIVLGVIAIVASILVPNIKGMQQEGDILKAKSEVKSLQTAIESYYLHHERVYPEKLDDLLEATPRILSEIPKDPFGSAAYQYEALSDYYLVWSNGPNKKKDYETDLTADEPYVKKETLEDDIVATSLLIKPSTTSP